jgi:hypothetical protein
VWTRMARSMTTPVMRLISTWPPGNESSGNPCALRVPCGFHFAFLLGAAAFYF